MAGGAGAAAPAPRPPRSLPPPRRRRRPAAGCGRAWAERSGSSGAGDAVRLRGSSQARSCWAGPPRVLLLLAGASAPCCLASARRRLPHARPPGPGPRARRNLRRPPQRGGKARLGLRFRPARPEPVILIRRERRAARPACASSSAQERSASHAARDFGTGRIRVRAVRRALGRGGDPSHGAAPFLDALQVARPEQARAGWDGRV